MKNITKHLINGLRGEILSAIDKNFQINIYWDWKDIGLGIIIYEPANPRSKHRIGITLRVLWLLVMIKLWNLPVEDISLSMKS